MASREIGQAEVERAIREPQSVARGNPPRKIFVRRYFDGVLRAEMLLRVVVEETERELGVVTLYKTSKLGKYLGE